MVRVGLLIGTKKKGYRVIIPWISDHDSVETIEYILIVDPTLGDTPVEKQKRGAISRNAPPSGKPSSPPRRRHVKRARFGVRAVLSACCLEEVVPVGSKEYIRVEIKLAHQASPVGGLGNSAGGCHLEMTGCALA